MNIFFFEERQHPIIEHIRRYQSIFAVIELSESDFGVSIDKGLLVDAANAFQSAHIAGILRTQVARMLRFDLSKGFLLYPGFSNACS